MNQIMQKTGFNLPVKEVNGQRVVDYKQEALETPGLFFYPAL